MDAQNVQCFCSWWSIFCQQLEFFNLLEMFVIYLLSTYAVQGLSKILYDDNKIIEVLNNKKQSLSLLIDFYLLHT